MARFPQTQTAAPLQRARLPQVSFGRGAGEGLAELGKGVATLGATLYDRTVQAKQERDAVKATNSFTAFSDSLGQSFIDRLSRKGANAFGVYEEYKTFYDNAAKKAAEQLENDDQVLFFAEKSAALRKSQLSRLQTLEAGAQQEAKSNSIGALRTITEKNANENVFDDASRELLLATYIKGYREQYPGQNVEEDINENVKDIRQNFLRMMIAQDPYKAKAYNTEWKSIIGGANYAANIKRIRSEIKYLENKQKKNDSDSKKAIENSWYKAVAAADGANNYDEWKRLIDNAPLELAKAARNERKALDKALTDTVTRTDPNVFDVLYDTALNGTLDIAEVRAKNLHKDLTRKDFEVLQKVNIEASDEKLEYFNDQYKTARRAIEETVGGGTSLIGYKFPRKKALALQDLTQAVQEGQKKGLSPEEMVKIVDLSDPDSEANKILVRHKPTLNDALEDMRRQLKEATPVEPKAAETPIKQRLPNETIADYLKRTGQK
jgi:hypothetical protein